MITKQHIQDQIKELERKTESLLSKLQQQNRLISELKQKNADLEQGNRKTLLQIKEYVKELEQIRAYYVSNNDKSK